MTPPDAPTAMTLEESLRDALGDMIHEFGAGAGWRTEKQEAALNKALEVFLARPVVARDPTAELAEAVKAWASAYRHAYEDPITGFEADAAGRNLDNAEVALLAALAAYEASRK